MNEQEPAFRLGDWQVGMIELIEDGEKPDETKQADRLTGNPDLATPAMGRRTAPRNYFVGGKT